MMYRHLSMCLSRPSPPSPLQGSGEPLDTSSTPEETSLVTYHLLHPSTDPHRTDSLPHSLIETSHQLLMGGTNHQMMMKPELTQRTCWLLAIEKWNDQLLYRQRMAVVAVNGITVLQIFLQDT